MQPPTNKNTGYARPWLLSTLVFTVLMVGVFALAVSQQRAITDWILLRDYKAPAAIAQMATEDSMTDDARHIFYVNRPVIEPKANFTKSCPNSHQEKTIVLGCYKSDQNGIFLLDVTDPRLFGVRQVTAAHEMLHAAYDRLSDNERASIDKQLNDYYKTGLTDERIKGVINAYKVSEPRDVVNEMHSIFGTEIATLPKGLETYYKQYFKDRSAVTNLSARYQAEFTSRRDQVAKYDAQLENLKATIDAREANIKTMQAEIDAKESNLNSLRNSNSIAAYNAGVPVYNGLIASYNAEVESVRSLVNEFNALVAKRNAIALEEDQLVKSLSAESETINN